MASKAIGFLNFKFGADLGGFERAMNKAQKKLTKFGKNVTKAGQNLSRNLTLPILALGAASIKAFDQQAKAETKLLTALKGREDVQQRLINQAKELQKVTLFGDEATIESQALLASLGLTEEQIMMLIPQIQNMATGLRMDLTAATSLVSKSVSTTTDALARYFDTGLKGVTGQQERAIVLTDALSKKFEGQAAAAAKVGAGPLIMMKNQLGDLGEELGQRLMPFVQKFVDWMVKLIGKFDNLSESTKDNIVKWGLILAAIGPVLIIIGKVSIGLGVLTKRFKKLSKWIKANPYTAAAVAIAAVGYAIYDTYIATKQLTTAQDDLDSISKTAQSSIMDEKVAVELLTQELTSQGLSLEDKKIALNKLKEISPQYYGSLEIAKGKVVGLDIATQNYTASLLQQAKAEAMKQKLVELNIELLEAEEKMQKQLATAGGFLGADLKGSDIEKSSIEALKEQKQLMQDRIDALSKEYNITKKISDLPTETGGTSATGGTTPTGGTGDVGKKVKQVEALSLATHDTFEEINLLSHRLDGLEMPEGLFNTDPLEEYRGALGDLGEQMANFFGKDIKEFEQMSYDATMSIAKNLSQGADSWEEYGQNVKNVIRETIGALISEAVMTAALSALKSVPFPFNIIAAGIAAGLARTAFNSMIPEFADGGLVYGPTTALIGEGVGTTASNPEVVAPLDKLKQYMGGGNKNIIIEGVLKGNDIYLSNRNTSINRLRTT